MTESISRWRFQKCDVVVVAVSQHTGTLRSVPDGENLKNPPTLLHTIILDQSANLLFLTSQKQEKTKQFFAVLILKKYIFVGLNTQFYLFLAVRLVKNRWDSPEDECPKLFAALICVHRQNLTGFRTNRSLMRLCVAFITKVQLEQSL